MPDRNTCLAIVASRDARYDGRFYTAVSSTGIYCRPSCPARTPKPSNTRFYPTAAAAQDAGFRACRRCRPDAVPGSPEWDVRADAVARAMRLVRDGLIDRAGVPALAAQVGYSVRQLQRLTLAELGASPLTLARAQRAHTARVLIETTDLPMTEVAFAAGSAVSAPSDAVVTAYGCAPSALRGQRTAAGRRPGRLAAIELRLAFRRPFEPSTSSGTSPLRCPGWRSGGTAPTAGHRACRTAAASWR